MKPQSLKVFGILLGVFALGFFSGWATRHVMVSQSSETDAPPDPPPHELTHFLKKKLTEDLDLTQKQEEQIESELQQMSEKLADARRDFKPIVNDIVESTHSRIQGFLSEEQWAQFQKNRKELHEWLSRKRDKHDHDKHDKGRPPWKDRDEDDDRHDGDRDWKDRRSPSPDPKKPAYKGKEEPRRDGDDEHHAPPQEERKE